MNHDTPPRVVSRAHVIVIGSGSAGAGKTTLALNIAAALTRASQKVGVIDLDLSQRTLSQFLSARRDERLDVSAPADERAFSAALQDMSAGCAYLIIDAPSTVNDFSLAAHARGDTLITTLVHSAELGVTKTGASLAPSAYSEMVWEARKQKWRARGGPIDWVVLRNRVERSGARNEAALAALSARMGFRIAPGLAERPIMGALFAQGRDLLDSAGGLSMPHVAARQDFRQFLLTLKLPDLRAAIAA